MRSATRLSSRIRLTFVVALALSMLAYHGRVSAAPRARECDLLALSFNNYSRVFTEVFNPNTLQRRPFTDKDLAVLHSTVDDRSRGQRRGHTSPLDPVSPDGRFVAADRVVFDRLIGRTIRPNNYEYRRALGWVDNHRLMVFNGLSVNFQQSGAIAVWDLGPEPVPTDLPEQFGSVTTVLDGDVVDVRLGTQVVYVRGVAHLLVGSQTSLPYLVPVHDPRRVPAFSGPGDLAIANHRLVQLGEKPGTSRAVLREFDPDGVIDRVVFSHGYTPHPEVASVLLAGPDEPVVIVTAEDFKAAEYVDLDTRKVTPISTGPRIVGEFFGYGVAHSFFVRFDSHSLFLARPGFKKLVPFTEELHTVASVGPPCKQRF